MMVFPFEAMSLGVGRALNVPNPFIAAHIYAANAKV
jgi:hypothetical protein